RGIYGCDFRPQQQEYIKRSNGRERDQPYPTFASEHAESASEECPAWGSLVFEDPTVQRPRGPDNGEISHAQGQHQKIETGRETPVQELAWREGNPEHISGLSQAFRSEENPSKGYSGEGRGPSERRLYVGGKT